MCLWYLYAYVYADGLGNGRVYWACSRDDGACGDLVMVASVLMVVVVTGFVVIVVLLI